MNGSVGVRRMHSCDQIANENTITDLGAGDRGHLSGTNGFLYGHLKLMISTFQQRPSFAFRVTVVVVDTSA